MSPRLVIQILIRHQDLEETKFKIRMNKLMLKKETFFLLNLFQEVASNDAIHLSYSKKLMAAIE